jgi:hypothetical protein
MPSSSPVSGRKPTQSPSAAIEASVDSTSPGCIGSSSRCACTPSARSERRHEVEQAATGSLWPIVEHAPRALLVAGIRAQRVVGGSGVAGLFEHPQHALHHVVDVGEVAQHVAAVEELQRPAGQHRLGEQRGRHVRAARRARRR